MIIFNFINHHFSPILDMSTTIFEANETVIGKSKALHDLLGIVQQVIVDGKKRKYTVLFADNKIKTVSSNSIAKITKFNPPNIQNQTTDVGDMNFEDGEGFVEDENDEASDSSDSDDELNRAFIL
jgi:hypothetical protein